MTLSSLRTKVTGEISHPLATNLVAFVCGVNSPRVLPRGTYAASEHEVELLGLGNLIATIGICDLVLAAELAQFWTRVVVELQRHDHE